MNQHQLIKLGDIDMKFFWNKLADSYFNKIEEGTLHVTYSNGKKKTYGNGELPEISIIIKKSRMFKEVVFVW